MIYVNRLRLYIIALVLLTIGGTNRIFAQQDSTQTSQPRSMVKLTGRIVDEDHEPVSFCNVRVEGGLGVLANVDGKYSLEFQSADSVTVVYSMIGYGAKRKVFVKPQGNLVWNLTLHARETDLQEVAVKVVKTEMTTTQELKTEHLKRLPSTTGNAVEELVATQAGVTNRNELSSQYNVRGGSFDENCVYINGVEVYRPLLISSGQQEGLTVINSDMVERVQFSAGGFEAKYGDKMSSVLDITYRRPEKTEGSVQASLLGANVYVGTGKKKISFSNGLRYKTNQYMLGSLETKGEYSPSFLDYQAYLSWRPTKQWTIDVIGYISKNNYKFKPKDRETNFGTMEDVKSFRVYFDGQEEDIFRTLFGTAKVTRQLGRAGNLSLAFSAFTTKERETYDIQGQYWLNETNYGQQLGVGTYMEHARNLLTSASKTLKLNYELQRREHTFLAGISWKGDHIKENAREWESRDSSGYSIPHTGQDLHLIYNLKSVNEARSNHLEVFAQDTWKHQSKAGYLSINYGLRMAYWDWNNECIVSPRVSVGYVPSANENFTFRLATGLYYQTPYFKELRDTMTTNGNTIVRFNRDIKSQRSFQVVAGMEYKFKVAQRPFKLTTELYYKAQSDLNPYNVDNVKVVYYGRNIASGYVVGADVKVFGEFIPGTDSWISFGIMKAQMTLNGKSIPQPTDQRYNLNFYCQDYFPGTDRWKFTLKACFADGLPFGTPHSGLEKHVFRTKAYKRIDVGMTYRAINNEDRHRRHNIVRNLWLGLDVFNLMNFNNVSGYYWVTDVGGQQYAVPNYLTGILPNVRMLIEF